MTEQKGQFRQLRALAVVDPFSTGALFSNFVMQISGVKVYRILTRDFPQVQLDFVPKGLTMRWDTTLRLDTGGLEGLVKDLSSLSPPPDYVIAAVESGVELADSLSEALDLPTNGTKLAHCRRDKYYMQDRLRECGLRSIRQFRCDTTTPWADIEAFIQGCEAQRGVAEQKLSTKDEDLKDEEARKDAISIVVKPVRSCGTDKVTYCASLPEVKTAMNNILGKENRLGMVNDNCVMQECLIGREYVVDSVSRDGVHKCTAVWEYDKRPNKGSRFVYCGMRLLSPDSDRFSPLIEYVHKCLDALGIRNNPSHAEIMFTASGPCLIEVGARFHGVKGSFVPCVNQCIGYNQVNVMLDALVNPERYAALPPRPQKLVKQGMQIFLMSPVEGTVKALPKLAEIRNLPSFMNMNIVEPGEKVTYTVDGWTCPGNVTLCHEEEAQMNKDYEFILQLVASPGFFVLEESA